MRSRCFTFCVAVVLGCAATSWGQTSSQELVITRDSVQATDDTPVRARFGSDSARAVLLKRVAEVRWDEIPFEEVIDWLRGISDDKVNIILRWNPLSAEGVDRDTLVSLQLRDVLVANVLNETMDQLSDTGQITYHAVGNTLRISSKVDFDRQLYRRVYEVTDILFRVPDFGRSAPTVDLEQAARSGGGGGGGGGQSIFGGGTSSSTEDLEQEESEVEERIADLRELIMHTVMPEIWEETLGGPGRIRVFDNRYLVVRAPIEVHEELIGYFAMER